MLNHYRMKMFDFMVISIAACAVYLAPVSAQDTKADAIDQKVVEKIIADALKKKDGDKTIADEALQPIAAISTQLPGCDGKLTPTWTPGDLLWQSPGKECQFHMGGYIDIDALWWSGPRSFSRSGPGAR